MRLLDAKQFLNTEMNLKKGNDLMIRYKKIISIAMLTVIMATTFSMNAFAADEPLTVSDGKNFEIVGENLTVLKTYSGTGQISPKYSDNIKNVEINPGVRRLVGTFQSYYNLTSVHIPSTVQTIGEDAFADCFGLQSITIPNSVTEIGDRAFMGCTNLTSITIPGSVDKIGQMAFSGCTKLKSITIPNSVTEIGDRAFMGCTNLTSITIPGSVGKIGQMAFSGCNLKSITIPGSVNTIDEYTFSGCTNLSSVDIKNGVKRIKAYAFRGCENLEEVKIPNSVIEKDKQAFYLCDNYKIVEEPLKEKEESKSQNIETWSSTDKFIDTPRLSGNNIIYPPTQISVLPRDNKSSDVSQRRTIKGSEKNFNYSFDESTGELNIFGWGEIAASPWDEYSHKIKSIKINHGLEKIGKYIFANYTGLKSVTITDTVQEIGDGAFNGCTYLEDIYIPDNVKSIGAYAFNGCTRLNKISLPPINKNVKIGRAAFNGCAGTEQYRN